MEKYLNRELIDVYLELTNPKPMPIETPTNDLSVLEFMAESLKRLELSQSIELFNMGNKIRKLEVDMMLLRAEADEREVKATIRMKDEIFNVE